jgi:hypothetical protein
MVSSGLGSEFQDFEIVRYIPFSILRADVFVARRYRADKKNKFEGGRFRGRGIQDSAIRRLIPASFNQLWELPGGKIRLGHVEMVFLGRIVFPHPVGPGGGPPPGGPRLVGDGPASFQRFLRVSLRRATIVGFSLGIRSPRLAGRVFGLGQ